MTPIRIKKPNTNKLKCVTGLQRILLIVIMILQKGLEPSLVKNLDLNQARLPIPPLEQKGECDLPNSNIWIDYSPLVFTGMLTNPAANVSAPVGLTLIQRGMGSFDSTT